MQVIIETGSIDPARRALEVVERKGVGHPDSLCDAAAEEFSRRLSRHYLERCGAILHHNVDKALLVGGRTRVAFGGGEWIDPIKMILAGRASLAAGDGRDVIQEIAEAATREAIAAVRHLDPRRVETEARTRPGAEELREVFGSATPRANDTSFGVGFAPLSRVEELALEIERRLLAQTRERASSPIGEDIKLMLVREQSSLRLTVATAMLADFVEDRAAYDEAVDQVRVMATQAAREADFESLHVDVNAADRPGGAVYLTLSGTSAECGDDGQVGRGNRLCGSITPMRPMTMEAYAGKNPCTHVGKLLSITARAIARDCAALDTVRSAECMLVSQIGAPVSRARAAGVRLDAPESARQALRDEITSIAEAHMAALPELWREIVAGDAPSTAPRGRAPLAPEG
jgi:S-adenosylmethionine synthetase